MDYRIQKVVDGIAGAFYRWPEPEPFFVTCIDFLQLGLFDPVDFTISLKEEDSGSISTRPRTLPRPSAADTILIAEDVLPLVFSIELRPESTSPPLIDRANELRKIVDAVTVNGMAGTWDRCAEGLRLLAQHQPANTSVEGKPPDVSTSSDRMNGAAHAATIGVRLGERLRTQLGQAGLPHSIVVQAYSDNGRFVREAVYDPSVPPSRFDAASFQAPRQWVETLATRAFNTGLVQWCKPTKHNLAICIPLHFGGVAWMAVVVVVDRSRAAWQSAYTCYREIIPATFGSLRNDAGRLLADDMLEVLRKSTEGADTGDDRPTRIMAGWKYLANLYPIGVPVLAASGPTLRPDDDTTEGGARLQIGEGTFDIRFVHEHAPFFADHIQRLSGSKDLWEDFSRTHLFQEGFLRPAIERLTHEKAILDLQMQERINQYRQVSLGFLAHELPNILERVVKNPLIVLRQKNRSLAISPPELADGITLALDGVRGLQGSLRGLLNALTSGYKPPEPHECQCLDDACLRSVVNVDSIGVARGARVAFIPASGIPVSLAVHRDLFGLLWRQLASNAATAMTNFGIADQDQWIELHTSLIDGAAGPACEFVCMNAGQFPQHAIDQCGWYPFTGTISERPGLGLFLVHYFLDLARAQMQRDGRLYRLWNEKDRACLSFILTAAR